MEKTTRVHDKSQYFMEDMNCELCLHYQGKSRHRKHGCKRAVCVCEEEKYAAAANGLIKRKRGWNKWKK